MSGWLSAFKLGRPQNELTFDLNPAAIEIREAQVYARQRTISGHLYKRVFRTSFPTISLESSYFSLTQRNAMASLLAITDTMLSFKLRDGDFQTVLEICYPTGATTLPIRENSAVLLSEAIVAAGGSSCITINGVYDNAAGTGTNYYTGGSYDDASFVIAPGTPLLTSNAHYVTYSYGGWLVEISVVGA